MRRVAPVPRGVAVDVDAGRGATSSPAAAKRLSIEVLGDPASVALDFGRTELVGAELDLARANREPTIAGEIRLLEHAVQQLRRAQSRFARAEILLLERKRAIAVDAARRRLSPSSARCGLCRAVHPPGQGCGGAKCEAKAAG